MNSILRLATYNNMLFDGDEFQLLCSRASEEMKEYRVLDRDDHHPISEGVILSDDLSFNERNIPKVAFSTKMAGWVLQTFRARGKTGIDAYARYLYSPD